MHTEACHSSDDEDIDVITLVGTLRGHLGNTSKQYEQHTAHLLIVVWGGSGGEGVKEGGREQARRKVKWSGTVWLTAEGREGAGPSEGKMKWYGLVDGQRPWPSKEVLGWGGSGGPPPKKN